jgi:hypothetical protein
MSGFDPESVSARFDDLCVTFERADGPVEKVEWRELSQVRIEVVEIEGARVPFLILDAAGWNIYEHCGFRGEDELVMRLKRLPSFDDLAFAIAYEKREPGVHTCWVRDDA